MERTWRERERGEETSGNIHWTDSQQSSPRCLPPLVRLTAFAPILALFAEPTAVCYRGFCFFSKGSSDWAGWVDEVGAILSRKRKKSLFLCCIEYRSRCHWAKVIDAHYLLEIIYFLFCRTALLGWLAVECGTGFSMQRSKVCLWYDSKPTARLGNLAPHMLVGDNKRSRYSVGSPALP